MYQDKWRNVLIIVLVIRERRRGVKPLYVAVDEDFSLSLTEAKNQPAVTYKFESLHGE